MDSTFKTFSYIILRKILRIYFSSQVSFITYTPVKHGDSLNNTQYKNLKAHAVFSFVYYCPIKHTGTKLMRLLIFKN